MADPTFKRVVETAHDLPVSRQVADLIIHSSDDPEILRVLALNPSEAKRISSLPASHAEFELGRLMSGTPSLPSVPSRNLSTGPRRPPSTPSAGIAAPKDPSAMDFQEYERWRNEGGERHGAGRSSVVVSGKNRQAR